MRYGKVGGAGAAHAQIVSHRELSCKAVAEIQVQLRA